MPLGNVGQRHSRATICDHLLAINIQPRSTDLTTLKFCPSHARPNALDDQTSFKFRDCTHDHNDRPTEWAFGINRLALTEELDAEPVEFIQHLQQVLR